MHLQFYIKKQVNEFIVVKIAIKINFRIEKVIFIVSYVKDVNKLVPENPFYEEFHLLKKPFSKLKKLKISSKRRVP